MNTRLASIIILASLACACSQAAGDPAAIGNPSAPAFAVDESWMALVDGDDPGSQSYDDAPREVRLSDYASERAPGTQIIMLLAAAGWCAPCQSEAAALNEFAAAYASRGVAVLTAVFQDPRAKPASLEFAKQWAKTFGLTVPTLIDSEFKTSKYFDSAQMPAAMLLDADDLRVLAIGVGADPGSDPLGKYRELVDYELAKR